VIILLHLETKKLTKQTKRDNCLDTKKKQKKIIKYNIIVLKSTKISNMILF
jgi:hypothetical protein